METPNKEKKMSKAISKSELIEVGYSPFKSAEIIRAAKLRMVDRGFDFYANRRLGKVPVEIVQEILGFNPFENSPIQPHS